MRSYILVGALVVALIVLGVIGTMRHREEARVSEVTPSHDAAETTALTFLQDVVSAAPPAQDPYAQDRVYRALSSRAKADVRSASVMQDIAAFVGIQDVPDQGVSVEDLEVVATTSVTVVLGLNYSGGRTLRAVSMVYEDGAWKVDRVTSRTDPDAPSDLPQLPPLPAPSDDVDDVPIGSAPGGSDGCYVGGCSSQLCSEDREAISTCEFRPEYACYRTATCERQMDGACGWTMTDELRACVAAPAAIQ